jgi:hypothetical protein
VVCPIAAVICGRGLKHYRLAIQEASEWTSAASTPLPATLPVSLTANDRSYI